MKITSIFALVALTDGHRHHHHETHYLQSHSDTVTKGIDPDTLQPDQHWRVTWP